jgi:hypothetical protein
MWDGSWFKGGYEWVRDNLVRTLTPIDEEEAKELLSGKG